MNAFDVYYSRDLDLDPMTFIYESDPYSMGENKLPTSRVSKVIVWQTDKQTDRHDRNIYLSLIHI